MSKHEFEIGDVVVLTQEAQEFCGKLHYTWRPDKIDKCFTISSFGIAGGRKYAIGPIVDEPSSFKDQAWYCDGLVLAADFKPMTKEDKLIKKIDQLWTRQQYYKEHVEVQSV